MVLFPTPPARRIHSNRRAGPVAAAARNGTGSGTMCSRRQLRSEAGSAGVSHCEPLRRALRQLTCRNQNRSRRLRSALTCTQARLRRIRQPGRSHRLCLRHTRRRRLCGSALGRKRTPCGGSHPGGDARSSAARPSAAKNPGRRSPRSSTSSSTVSDPGQPRSREAPAAVILLNVHPAYPHGRLRICRFPLIPAAFTQPCRMPAPGTLPSHSCRYAIR